MARGNALVSFKGTKIDDGIAELAADPRTAGVVLYGPLNIIDAEQTKELTSDLVDAAGRSLIFAVDQEGGQLLGAGPDLTPFAGNMALGAVGDPKLTRAIAGAIGRELRGVGINVNLAPVADVASRPHNPGMGIRSFGDDPAAVATHVSAFVEGTQDQGVAATLKHFPGKGEATVDPHHELPVLDLDRDHLDRVELPPFRAGIEAGAKLLMVGHYGLPAVTLDENTPTSVSDTVMDGLIRGELGYEGVIVTDALDMGGFSGFAPDAPLTAGADLLLFGPAQAGLLPTTKTVPSTRLDHLFTWLEAAPPLEPPALGSARHSSLATELARRSVTLVKDDAGLLPLQPDPDVRILAIMPQPRNLTPADTSASVPPMLASSLRRRHAKTTEIVVPFEPSDSDITGCREEAAKHGIVVVGTIDATNSQADLVKALCSTAVPIVTVALRTPYDLAAYPVSGTHLCTYGILEPTMIALADVLFGAPPAGRLPVPIPGLFSSGHGMQSFADHSPRMAL